MLPQVTYHALNADPQLHEKQLAMYEEFQKHVDALHPKLRDLLTMVTVRHHRIDRI